MSDFDPRGGGTPVFAGRYRRLGRLGSGGMASVFLAEDEVLGRHVAVKRLHSASPEDLQARFRREARLGAALNHPNVVTIFDSVTDEDSLYIVMEYVKGESLDARIDRGRVEPALALGILEQSAAALDHVHSQGIVHRDVKPSNLMVREDGVVKVADLGIATATDASAITASGSVMGTLPYMAPERLRGDAGGPASDIYSLAAVAFELLAGHRAIQAKTPEEAMRLATAAEAPDLRSVWSEAPPELSDTLRTAMAVDPDQRHTSACKLIGDLEDALDRDGATTEQLAAATIPFTVIPEVETQAGGEPPVRAPVSAHAAAAAAEKAAVDAARRSSRRSASGGGDPPTAPQRRQPQPPPPPVRAAERRAPAPSSGRGSGDRASRSAIALAIGALVTVALIVVALVVSSGDGDSNTEGNAQNASAQNANGGDGNATPAEDATEPTDVAEPEPAPEPEPEPEPVPEPTGDFDTARAAELNTEGFGILNSGDPETALGLFEEAYSLYPPGSADTEYSYILYNLGTALVELGRGEEAIPYLQERLDRFDDRDEEVAAKLAEAEAQAAAD